mmetsp:Transcript_663/g.1243  ORF Transcript_663/g.1243 Transcript_663/m.1243 type:complete len:95 (-) Transcript_663:680-964(-)
MRSDLRYYVGSRCVMAQTRTGSHRTPTHFFLCGVLLASDMDWDHAFGPNRDASELDLVVLAVHVFIFHHRRVVRYPNTFLGLLLLKFTIVIAKG